MLKAGLLGSRMGMRCPSRSGSAQCWSLPPERPHAGRRAKDLHAMGSSSHPLDHSYQCSLADTRQPLVQVEVVGYSE